MTQTLSDTLDGETLAHLRTWQGRRETAQDCVSAAAVAAMSATLDRDDPLPVAGTPLPHLWHWLLFQPHARHSEIGPDGHARRGGFLPPVPLPRRMWAGGQLHWSQDNPLCVGDAVTRESCIQSVTHKSGRSGDLLFVQLEHRLHNAKGLAVTELQDLVYKAAAPAAASSGAPEPAAHHGLSGKALWSRPMQADAVLLFRYSALTFNGHRIHYDRDYAMGQESYPGLVVHGPLIASLLLDLLRRQWPAARLSHFRFKAVHPTFDLHPFVLYGRPSDDGRHVDVWAEDHRAVLTMQAQATLV